MKISRFVLLIFKTNRSLVGPQPCEYKLVCNNMHDPMNWPLDSRSLYFIPGHVHVRPMGKWPWRCTSTDQRDSHYLDLGSISLVFIEFRQLQGSKSTYYAHGHAVWPRCANDYEVAHLKAKTVQMNLICSESTSGWVLTTYMFKTTLYPAWLWLVKDICTRSVPSSRCIIIHQDVPDKLFVNLLPQPGYLTQNQLSKEAP